MLIMRAVLGMNAPEILHAPLFSVARACAGIDPAAGVTEGLQPHHRRGIEENTRLAEDRETLVARVG